MEPVYAKRYRKLLQSYFNNSKETELMAAAELGREFVYIDTPPEDIIEIHFDALQSIKKNNVMSFQEFHNHTSTVLMELFMSYGLAYRELQDQSKQRQQQLKNYTQQLQEQTGKLEKTNDQLKQAYQQLQATQIHLVQTEKMVSIGQLTAGVAHEINNPLSFVISNSLIIQKTLVNYQNLLKEYRTFKSSLENHENFHRIEEMEEEFDIDYVMEAIPNLYRDSQDGMERIRKIVLALKDFSHGTEFEQEMANPIEGLENTLNLLGFQLRKQIEVIKIYHEIPRIICSISELNQVFMNVLVNAIQAIKGKGVITIQVLKEGSFLVIEIKDTGEGIPVEVLPYIFEPFYTTKKVGKGTGLGLSISYGIIEKHHGKISFSSEVGKGTTCRIELPIK